MCDRCPTCSAEICPDCKSTKCYENALAYLAGLAYDQSLICDKRAFWMAQQKIEQLQAQLNAQKPQWVPYWPVPVINPPVWPIQPNYWYSVPSVFGPVTCNEPLTFHPNVNCAANVNPCFNTAYNAGFSTENGMQSITINAPTGNSQ